MRKFLQLMPFFFFLITTAYAQEGSNSTEICPDGQIIEDPVRIFFAPDPQINYTVTVLGIDDFDPMVGFFEEAGGIVSCNDDNPQAANYTADLPTTGLIESSAFNAQLSFRSAGEPGGIVVGSFDGVAGEYLILIEGSEVTTEDAQRQVPGDIFSIQLAPSVTQSENGIYTYMISVSVDLDPLIEEIDAQGNVIEAPDGIVQCDDAGDPDLCYGLSFPLDNSFITYNGGERLPTFEFDAMLQIEPFPPELLSPDPNQLINHRFTSFEGSGPYVAAFHIGTVGTEQAPPPPQTTPEVEGFEPTPTQETFIPTSIPPTTQPPPVASSDEIIGISAICPDGSRIENGFEIQVGMPVNTTYLVTALGIGDFDPIIAIGTDRNNIQQCNNSNANAGTYSANLPTTGIINPSSNNAQLEFPRAGENPSLSIIVGDANGRSGEFLLLFEGLTVLAEEDGIGITAGDRFSARLMPNLMDSGVPLSAYMLSRADAVDPIIRRTLGDQIALDGQELEQCDDAGDSKTCYSNSSSLLGASITTRDGTLLSGTERDAMLSRALAPFAPLSEDIDLRFLNWRFTAFDQEATGEYVAAFHAGINNREIPAVSAGVQPTATSPAQPPVIISDEPPGITVTCPDGTLIRNGFEILVRMPPDTTYITTALGIGDFDPIIAIGPDQNNIQQCNNSNASAGSYSANLPTAGIINPSPNNAQLEFSRSLDESAFVSVIVGDANGQSGEFLLLFEALSVSPEDGTGITAGDVFSTRLMPNMLNSGIPLSIYMLSLSDGVDPIVRRVSGEQIATFGGEPLQCDDAGDSKTCFSNSSSLLGASITGRDGTLLSGTERDAMLSLPLESFAPLNEDIELRFLNWYFTAFDQSATGEYTVAFHVGLNNQTAPDSGIDLGAQSTPAPPIVTPEMTEPFGITAICPDGSIIPEGFEILIEVPANTTYVATVLGIGFTDPIVAVGEDRNNITACNDNSPTAELYTARLAQVPEPSVPIRRPLIPEFLDIDSFSLNSRIDLRNLRAEEEFLSLIIGDVEGLYGEFLVIIEDLAAGPEDGTGIAAGDRMFVRLMPNMIISEIPLSVYMIGVDDELDPLLNLVINNERVGLHRAEPVTCDDAGNEKTCFRYSVPLTSMVISTLGITINGSESDAMVRLELDVYEPLSEDIDARFLPFHFTSFNQQTTGRYLVAFHVGIDNYGDVEFDDDFSP